MRIRSGIFFLSGLYLLASAIVFASESDAPAPDVKMLHLFIRADINEVHFENIWVFERQTPEHQGEVNIELPDGVYNVILSEPNDTQFMHQTGIIRKKMAADATVDSVSFSFALPNRNGACRTFIKTGYKVNSMVVSVAGRSSKLLSDVLKANEFLASHSDAFSGLYTAYNLPAGTKTEINLINLPHKNSRLSEIVCIIGLELIIIAALLMLLCQSRKS